MFDDGSDQESLNKDEQVGDLTVNKEFARRYEYNNARVEKERLQQKYGNEPVEESEESYDSENGSEDSEALMLTEKAEVKFNELIKKIQKGDKHFLQHHEGEYFDDNDFEAEETTKKEKKITYKDVIRKDALERIDNDKNASDSDNHDEDMFARPKHGETIAAEEARLKAEFKKAADHSSKGSSNNDYDSSDDGFMVKKDKPEEESDDGQEVKPKSIKPQKMEL